MARVKRPRAPIPDEVVRAWVEGSRAEQGFEPRVTDPAVLEDVAVLFATSRPDEAAISARRG